VYGSAKVIIISKISKSNFTIRHCNMIP